VFEQLLFCHRVEDPLSLCASFSIVGIMYQNIVFSLSAAKNCNAGNLYCLPSRVTCRKQITQKTHSFSPFLSCRSLGGRATPSGKINSLEVNYEERHLSAVALHSTEALMAGFLKSSDLGGHPHGYGAPHHPHHSHGPPLPPGMPMSMTPFGLPHGLDAVGFPHQGMWGKYCFQFSILTTH
jgi:hypothetical protein